MTSTALIVLISLIVIITIVSIILVLQDNGDTDKSQSLTVIPRSSLMLGGSPASADVINDFIGAFNIVWPGYCMNSSLDPWKPEGGIVIPVTADLSRTVANGIRLTVDLTTCLSCQMDNMELNLGTFTQLSGLRNLQITDLLSTTNNTATFRFHVFDYLTANVKDTKIRVRCHCGFGMFTHNDWHTFGGCSTNNANIMWDENATVGTLTISFDPNNFFNSIKFTNLTWIDTPHTMSNFSGCTDVLAIADFLDDVFSANILGGQVDASAKAIEDGLTGTILDELNNQGDNIIAQICRQLPSGMC